MTISWRWHAPDYQANAFRPLSKKIGGFFVGCSVEGLMALGTVRAHKGVRAPHPGVNREIVHTLLRRRWR